MRFRSTLYAEQMCHLKPAPFPFSFQGLLNRSSASPGLPKRCAPSAGPPRSSPCSAAWRRDLIARTTEHACAAARHATTSRRHVRESSWKTAKSLRSPATIPTTAGSAVRRANASPTPAKHQVSSIFLRGRRSRTIYFSSLFLQNLALRFPGEP